MTDVDARGDVVCEHGTAMDVHCCNCHSGFLFDASACVCGTEGEPMCEHGTEVMVGVKIPADLSCDGKEQWKSVGIDACIAHIVKALQEGGIDMCGSCCGHGGRSGHIHLQDGRGLLILSPQENSDYLRRTTAASPPATMACGCPWEGHTIECRNYERRYSCGCVAIGPAVLPSYCPEHAEAH
jgi:hypothetical protein